MIHLCLQTEYLVASVKTHHLLAMHLWKLKWDILQSFHSHVISIPPFKQQMCKMSCLFSVVLLGKYMFTYQITDSYLSRFFQKPQLSQKWG